MSSCDTNILQCLTSSTPSNLLSARVELTHFVDALNLLPPIRKAALEEAIRRNPQLVITESNPDRFILSENLNIWKAADKYATYWEERKKVFGQRFCLPMNMTGQGALTPEDIEVVSQGAAVILPNDIEGSPVVRWDRFKLNEGVDVDHRTRLAFYMLHELSQIAGSQIKGILAVAVLRGPANPLVIFASSSAKYALDQIYAAFPIRLKRVLLLFPPPLWGRMPEMDYVLRPIFKVLNSNFSLLMLSREDAMEYVDILMVHGLLKAGIPIDMGGEWSYQRDFLKWQASRGVLVSREKNVRGAQPLLFKPPPADERLSSPPPTAQSHQELRAAKRKQMGVVYSRRKRIRQKAKLETLQNDAREAHVENGRLKREHGDLRRRVQDALKVVRCIEETGSPLPGPSTIGLSKTSDRDDVDNFEGEPARANVGANSKTAASGVQKSQGRDSQAVKLSSQPATLRSGQTSDTEQEHALRAQLVMDTLRAQGLIRDKKNDV